GGLGVAQRTPKKDRWYLQPPGMSDSASHVFVLNFDQDQLAGRCVRLDRTLADQFQILPRKIETKQAFLVTGDPQYLAEKVPDPSKLDPYSEEANKRFMEILKNLPGEAIPAESVAGNVSKAINGVLVTGDLIDSADKNGGNYPAMQRFEWDRYKTDYGLTGKDGGLPYPVYEMHGNHDGPQGDTFIVEDIVKRNATRPGIVNVSENGLHYSWDWGPLHLVSLGIFVGEGEKKREQFHYAPRGSLGFLISDLESQVGDTGRPVVLAFHLHPNGPEYDWPPEDLQQFWDVVEKYNVIAMFHGHTHGSPPSRMQWLNDKFAPELEGGIDFFNPDDSAAAKTNPQDAANPIGLAHGFLYVEMLDRPGKINDELIVRSVFTKDNWATRSWGKVWRKSIQIPAKKK
ncbi:MAG: metallophosphoesterase, partial [Pirellulaceae bacterium]|nr:metallophosphoesterase [Pirellulaceae bacterium]